MLIIYDKNTGQVIESQTIGEYPLGLPDATFLMEHISKIKNIPVSQCGEFRLHDVEDAELIAKTSTHEYTIQNGKVVFGNVRPFPQPEPQPPTLEEQLAEKEKQILELKENQFKINRTMEANVSAQQELLELLIDMGVL